MTSQNNVPPRPACAICGKPADAVVLGKHVCAPCYLEATDDTVRIYRKSFAVVKGGLRE